MDDQIDSIIYLPVSTDWQHEKCRLLGLSFIRGNKIKSKDLVRNGLLRQHPELKRRWELRSLAQVLTGSQDRHKEVHLFVTSYMYGT